ncbi:MAG TPA: rhodanese-like domain-containing protein [Pirellulales bacterium]|jgi:rhodanese-related sulfurtransferase|nr:rhodanese-like domain-containing protein [Pirellulales bacterium]
MPHGPRFQKRVADAKAHVRELTPAEAAEQQRSGGTLIDVRESEEFQKGHAAKALHLSKGVIEWKIEEHISDPNATILCYCGGGSRSVLAAESLQKMGYTNVFSVSGGYAAWQKANLPTET